MNKARQVRQHVRWKTVHELDFNGDTLCGNGRRDGYASYTTLLASAVAGQKACLGCAGRAARRGLGEPGGREDHGAEARVPAMSGATLGY